MRRSAVDYSRACLAVLLSAGLLAACAAKTVNDVMADPGRYRDREVSVKGEVAESVGVLGRGFFKLQDGSGSLWVYTTVACRGKVPACPPKEECGTWLPSINWPTARACRRSSAKPSELGSCWSKATGRRSDT